MRTLSLLAVLSLALVALPPVDASAPVCSSLRNPQCDGTVCYYDHNQHVWVCHFPIDWDCLVWRPCWYPAIP